MGPTNAHDRPPTRRQILGDATSRANVSRPSNRRPTTDNSFSSPIPHHESLKPGGNLAAVSDFPSPKVAAGNPRVSAVVNEDVYNSNRNSQISTTSTKASGKRKTHIGPWQLGRTLGKGATARVRLARNVITGQFAAVKVVSKKSAVRTRATSLAGLDALAAAADGEDAPTMPFGIEREVVLMRLLQHPNVINLYDVWENHGELYLVLEHVEGGELFDYVANNGRLPEWEAVRLFRQLIAGLSHCHRFNVYHRDLKPENILLDRDCNVKLADFGMAALQPVGVLLETSCGSPHYAAPEVLSGHRYRGDKVDIWSCGVVLYTMIAGQLPFNGPTLADIFKQVKLGRLMMPTDMSMEARDLIHRMLRRDPNVRIDMAGVRQHPLMTKYKPEGGYTGIDSTLEAWADISPYDLNQEYQRPIGGRDEIDKELLRNLQTLWHRETKEDLIKKLLDHEPNQQKYFYRALMKYREDQLENFAGAALGYSASDYHHSKPAARGRTPVRQQSQYSIISSDYIHPRDAYYDEPRVAKTGDSYDPFRASSGPMGEARASYANVTVHRGRQPHTRHAATIRSHGPSSSRASVATSRRSHRAARRDGHDSRSSLVSSQYPSSPPVLVPRGSRRKRGVSFSHLRKRVPSGSPEVVTQRLESPRTPVRSSPFMGSNYTAASRLATYGDDSPIPTREQIVRSRKGPAVVETNVPRTKKSRVPSHAWNDETRHVSSELEKFCDELFNGPPVSELQGSTPAEKPNGKQPNHGDTLRSVSVNGPTPHSRSVAGVNIASLKCQTLTASYSRQGAFPDQQVDSEGEMETSGRRIHDRDESEGYLDDVIAHLDRLMQPSTAAHDIQDMNRRIASAPGPRTPMSQIHLPAISEEGRFSDADASQGSLDEIFGMRSVSQPMTTTRQAQSLRREVHELETIRLVGKPPQNVPADAIPALNIRKRNVERVLGAPNGRPMPEKNTRKSPMLDFVDIEDEMAHGQSDNVGGRKGSGDQKLKSWFKRRSKHMSEGSRETSASYESSQEKQNKDARAVDSTGDKRFSGASQRTTTFPAQPGSRKSSGASKKGLFRMFGKRESGHEDEEILPYGDSVRDNDMASDVVVKNKRNQRKRVSERLVEDVHFRSAQPQQSWFMRLFHIKPATALMCFATTKTKARREVATVLRGWRKYGLRDVAVDAQRSLVFGRVDQNNYLRIKEVEFVCEVMTVLEHGRRAQLSIARFTQQRGAASSFHKVVGTLEAVMKSRDILVKDSKKRAEICKVLG
ncbi:Pkinase-domain-containing protein [Xylona heveae TC161]|uniref:non-specific serine/threonine protein kinase n=1 Tax=Xylona heveae (strain CBS 132557 / TC161) TaxID=1328760 RepID=A0A165FFY7_XYLHT|nr:Pkinase-domain-containing protein [Xylona heveae TC161]KZF20931.1 Pkinase-domain-containing protein [Xylona heveae TC161]